MGRIRQILRHTMALIQRRTEDIGARNNPTDWSAKLPNPKTHIRLLTILPGRQTEELRCTCSTISLDSRPRYNALSYVWGNPDEKAQVIVNGVQVTVNRSLAEALSRIRRQQGPVVIWADALCINQSDEDEKKYQIDLMHRIYGECENCFVWMGDIVVKGDSSVAAKQAAAGALNALRIIAEEPHHEELGWPGEGPVARSPAGSGLTAGVALQSMMDCEWWHRIWTVQEVCLPPKATVLWGPLEISFQTIMDAASYMVQPDEHPQHNNIFDLFQDGTAIYPKLHTSPFTIPVLSIAHTRFWDQSRTDSLNRLWRFRDRRSTYPKDKLFGIWALLNKKYLPNITPADYVLDIVVLFSRVTVSLLTSLNNLKPLIGWRGERETAGLPTWVLDLAQPEDSKCTSDFWTHDIAWRQFYAGRGLPRFKPLLNQAENFVLLTLNGIRVDKVATVLMDLRNMRRSLWRHACESALRNHASKDNIMYQYNNLIQGKFGEHHEPITDESWRQGPWWEDRMLSYQVLFITEENRLGLGPPNLKPGNNVWTLSGGNHPFLLHPVRERNRDTNLWEFVGDCFVYGIMYGEASSGGLQLSSVTLC
ncbi:heterokaryon incompatibility protein-domain-containing protein [Colletotrichum godetiae]|uniref:Heterokaryon incompatibility protein-domain-containing protein n=1 Tax=Colletotrichum godetiae TaxID=1209918 RepID=A0AAJ0ERE5_9PEZI|nr:heterokaryon incompatibility protein-domain-containing protein [Colletotrichum godetiae]KAK1671258.1 heterokaryon incompatibility protein-domain-containing protein [Colletotrichum godetiae]